MDSPVDDDVMHVVLALVQSTHHGDTRGQAELLGTLHAGKLAQTLGSLVAMAHALIECLAEHHGVEYDVALTHFFGPELSS